MDEEKLEAIVQDIAELKLLLRDVHKLIPIPNTTGIQFLDSQYIVRVVADRSYCSIHLNDGEQIVVSKPLKAMDEILPESKFIRVHTSHIVHVKYIHTYSTQDCLLVLLDGTQIPVARRRRKEVLDRMLKK